MPQNPVAAAFLPKTPIIATRQDSASCPRVLSRPESSRRQNRNGRAERTQYERTLRNTTARWPLASAIFEKSASHGFLEGPPLRLPDGNETPGQAGGDRVTWRIMPHIFVGYYSFAICSSDRPVTSTIFSTGSPIRFISLATCKMPSSRPSSRPFAKPSSCPSFFA